MKRSLLISSCAALAQAQSFQWDVIDAAPPATKVTVPVGGQPVSVPYDRNAAIASIEASINPPTLPVTVTRKLPDLGASIPAAIVSSVASKVIPSVAVPSPTTAPTLNVVRRDTPCATQPIGSGPVPTPDTAANFLSLPDFATAANKAQVPNNYVQTFANLTAANNDYGFLGLVTLTSYDPQACATACDHTNGCSAINIYYERDPTLAPDNDACPNPASTTTIKCVFWGGPVSLDNAGDKGRMISNFQVVMAGSNGYVKKKFGNLSGYASPLNGVAVNAAINAPNDCTGSNTFMGAKTFTSGPFDAGLCAAACAAQTKYNLAHPPATGAPQTCQFFNTYMLMKNSISLGQICAMYNESWDQSYFTNNGQWRGQDHYTSTFSLSYSNTTNPGIPAGLAADPKNCGACGNVCGASSQCVAGTCQLDDLCQKVQGGAFDQSYIVSEDSDPEDDSIAVIVGANATQASQFQLDRNSQHLSILRPNGAQVLYAYVIPGVKDGFNFIFNPADVDPKYWTWIRCQITGGGLLACNDGGYLNTAAYESRFNELYLSNGNKQGLTNIGLKPVCI
ncbi:carbohydrate-binding -like protein [Apiospora sp. TS-2023a]